ncbi:hypothetical protein ACP275_12G045900 [Erythranthe tilingii]
MYKMIVRIVHICPNATTSLSFLSPTPKQISSSHRHPPSTVVVAALRPPPSSLPSIHRRCHRPTVPSLILYSFLVSPNTRSRHSVGNNRSSIASSRGSCRFIQPEDETGIHSGDLMWHSGN